MNALDPQMAAILDLVREAGLRSYDDMTPLEARAESLSRARIWNEGSPEVWEIRDLECSGPRQPIKLRLYRPQRAPTLAPVVFYIHGGGWMIGSIESHDGVCRGLANAGSLTILSIEYGLAPEEPFPCGLDDVRAVIEWVEKEGQALGLDATRFALAGDSAGANLALAALIARRDEGRAAARAAALIYGAFSADFEGTSYQAFADRDLFLTAAMLKMFWDAYVPDPTARSNPLISPLFAELKGLPPLFVAAAEFDPIRDDSERLARRLIEVGSDFDYRLWRGVTHACLPMSNRLDAARGFIVEIATFLRQRLKA